MSIKKIEVGFSLVEIMIGMAIAGIALVGTMGAVELAMRWLHQTEVVGRAQAAAQSRLEAKRSVRWRSLLEDDLDMDGIADTVMRDDGQGFDQAQGDGVFTSGVERDGITEVWTLEVDRTGPLPSVGMVVIRSIVTYEGRNGPETLRMETIRSNPSFVGLPQF